MIYNGNIMDIMKIIEHLKIDLEMTNNEIAAKMGKSKQTVSNLLNGQSKNITLDTLNNLCDAIGCDLIIDIRKRN
nr:MAG TPA: Cro/C1-type HTH DNA-binding domain protein [Caudoviricetes sp.]